MTDRTISREGTQAVVTLGENLVASNVLEVRNELRNLLQEGVVAVVIDMVHVEMLDSSGIGCLVAAHNSLSKKGGSLMIFNASPNIYELFKSMRLDRHFSIMPANAERTQ